jgi:TRAP transporter TAXI family solute receptor
MGYRKIASLVAALMCLSVVTDAKAEEFLSIGTGGITGVYYAVGGSICRLVNKETKDHGIRCSTESTGGSVYNVNTIRSGDMGIAIIQSDVQYLAHNGLGRFEKDGAFEGLRAVFAVHPEMVTLIARKDKNISNVEDLVGKRVNIGNPGSGTEAVWNAMWTTLGHSNDDLALAAQMKSSEGPAALCDDKVDVINWVAGHPLTGAQEAANSCEVNFVEVSGEKIDALVAENAYFNKAEIPGGLYKGTDNPTPTFGVGAVFVSSTNISADTIYEITKAVFENLDAFRKLHPALALLTPEDMINNAKSSPFHEGAIRYYKEAGLME